MAKILLIEAELLLEPLIYHLTIQIYVNHRERGQWAVYYTSHQSFKIAMNVQTFQPLIVIRGNFVY